MKKHTSVSLEQKAYISNTCDAAMDEDEMLKKAIAMFLEGETGARFGKGMMSTITFRWQGGRDNCSG